MLKIISKSVFFSHNPILQHIHDPSSQLPSTMFEIKIKVQYPDVQLQLSASL